MNHKMYDLDLQVHRFPTADGRHFSTAEQADEADGKITLEESIKRTRERYEMSGKYDKRKNH